MSLKDNSKNTIRVLIDRYPQSQSLDVTFQKIKPLIDESHYTLSEFPDDERLVLSLAGHPTIEFLVIRDEVTRALKFLRGDADILYDTLSLAKTEWVRKQKSQIQIYENEGHTLSYLAFQTHHPILSNVKVRHAIAAALPIDEWIKYKFFNWVTRDHEIKIDEYNLNLANQLLDEAGYPLVRGSRFSLRYFTTPVREGNDTAQLIKEALEKVGIDVKIEILETSLFFSKILKGNFDLFSTRWFRESASARVAEIIRAGEKRNYLDYQNKSLEKLFQENPNLTLSESAPLLEKELPFIPLYNWKHGLIVGSRILAPTDIALNLDESFRFLTRLDLAPELK